MANKKPMSADEYYQYYLEQTSKSTVTAQVPQHNNPKSSSAKNGFIALLVLIILAGAYYVWQLKNQKSTPVVVKKESPALKVAIDKKTQILKQDKIKNIPTIKPIEKKVEQPLKKQPMIAKVAPSLKAKPTVTNIVANASISPLPVTVEKIIKKAIPVIKEKIVPIDTRLQENLKQESKKINDLAEALLSGIEESSIPMTSTKIKKVDTFNKVVIEADAEIKQTTNKENKITSIVNDSKKEKNIYTQALKVEAKTREDEMQFVVVQEGDTLFYIAKRIYGDAMKYPIIFEANPDILNDPARISIGQKLRVPKLKESNS